MLAEKKKDRESLFEGGQYKESLESENRRLKSISSELSAQIDLLEKKLELYQDTYVLKWVLANQT
jgi:predicted RNase H-like nuclease (RuvC/YqgF family)